MHAELQQRPICEDDLPFLLHLYATTREQELASSGWPESVIANFLAQQFNAQHRHYQAQFADAEFMLLLIDARPIGRIYVDRRSDEIRIIDIAILPGLQGQGIGTRLLRDCLRQADRLGLPVRLHVECSNSALAWYRRHGFEVAGGDGVYHRMERQPVDPAAIRDQWLDHGIRSAC